MNDPILESSLLATLSDANPVPCFVIDAQHRIIQWNHACEKILGFSAASMLGSDRQWQPFYASPRATLADVIVENNVVGLGDGLYGNKKLRRSAMVAEAYEAEDFFPHMGERGRWLFFTAAPIRNAAGELIGAVETLQDITSQREAEIALQASHDELERQVAARTAELAESNRQLSISLAQAETVNRLKSAFLSTVSHELKTPLNGIIGFSDLIAIEQPDSIEAEYARQINTSGRQLFRLVTNMITLTELEAGEASLSEHPFDLHEVMEGLEMEYCPLAQARGSTLEFRHAGPAFEVLETDPKRLRDSMAALIDNSIRHMDKAAGHITVTCGIADGMLRVRVEDDGPGIPEAAMGEIFEKFRFNEGYSSRLQGGMGLGLAITRAQVQLLGGTIRHERPPGGEGSHFELNIPLRPPHPENKRG